MSSTCRPMPDRRQADWATFYRRNIPHVLYRVQSPTRSYTKYDSARGFIPSAGVTRRTYTRSALHDTAIEHCLGYTRRTSSPFVSLTASLGYAIWEAHRRVGLTKSLTDSVLWFVDARILLSRRYPRRHLFHAVDVIENFGPYSVPSACSADCQRAMRFANAADELLILGTVPREAIIGSVLFTDLVPSLPPYFFYDGVGASHAAAGIYTSFLLDFSRMSYRELYDNLVERIALDTSGLDMTLVAERAFLQASMVREAQYPGQLQRMAQDIASWLINWEAMRVDGLDIEIEPRRYIEGYLRFRTTSAVNHNEGMALDEEIISSQGFHPTSGQETRSVPDKMDQESMVSWDCAAMIEFLEIFDSQLKILNDLPYVSNGFVAPSTLEATDDRSLHDTITEHCRLWGDSAQSFDTPFVALSTQFTYCVWEALRRSIRRPENFEQYEIWFIDATKLREVHTPGEELWHSVDLLKRTSDSCDKHKCDGLPLNCANLFDEIVVLDNVPPEVIMGHITLKDLLPILPRYFVRAEYRGFGRAQSLSPKDLFGGWYKDSRGDLRGRLRDALREMENNLPQNATLLDVIHEANVALKIATQSCQKTSPRGYHVSRCVRTIALGIAHSVVDWEEWDKSAEAAQALSGQSSKTLINSLIMYGSRVEVDQERQLAYWIGDWERSSGNQRTDIGVPVEDAGATGDLISRLQGVTL
ncbi:hypothetical protein DL93DRAFT_2096948 [Clavulina sp. PMI_390]|nr:hypothetical protein DL93DRAFT_2096948 [Clavulina sp. PMI_390]